MKPIQFLYKQHEIAFLHSENSVMVNATQMAKVYDKRLDHFLRTDNTKAFIKELEFTLFGVNSERLKQSEIIKSKGQSGTFMHRILALKLAAWLDPKFEVWVFSTIDKILYHHFHAIKDTTIEKLKIEKAKELMLEELLKKYPDDFYKFLELEGKLTQANQKRLRAIRASTKELQLNLFHEEITKG